MADVVSLFDSFRNFVSGVGTFKDKVMHQEPALRILDPRALTNLYRGDWVSRKICDIPAFDSTRAWRQWQAEKKDLKKLEDAEKEFALQRKMLYAISRSRLYGGAAIILGVDQGTFKDELDLKKVGKDDLKFVHVVERWMIAAGARVRDITSPWYGEPQYYMRSDTPIPPSPGGVQPLAEHILPKEQPSGGTFYIHPSRVIQLIGADYPDMEMAPDPWGDSALQPVYDAIRDASLVTSSLASLAAELKTDIIHLPGLTEKMQTSAGTTKLIDRFTYSNMAKSNINTLLLDKEEEFERREARLNGADRLLMSFLTIVSGAADIPSTRMLGRSPAGENATGESDMRNYYDRLAAEQVVHHTPALNRLDEVLIRSTFGSRPEEMDYKWRPLWQDETKVKAMVALQKAQAHMVDVQAGLINPDALRIGRQNDLVDDGFLYPGLEAALEECDQKGEFDVEEHMGRGEFEEPSPEELMALKAKMQPGGGPPPGGRPPPPGR